MKHLRGKTAIAGTGTVGLGQALGFPSVELMGLLPEGRRRPVRWRRGRITPGGALPAMFGLFLIAEAATQIRGDADACQISR
jgi:hypothetical protein